MTAVVKTAKRAPLVPLFYPNWITLWRRERCYLQSIEQIPGFNPIIVILSSEELIYSHRYDAGWWDYG